MFSVDFHFSRVLFVCFLCVCVFCCCVVFNTTSSPPPRQQLILSYHTHYYHKHMYSNDVVRQLTRYAGWTILFRFVNCYEIEQKTKSKEKERMRKNQQQQHTEIIIITLIYFLL